VNYNWNWKIFWQMLADGDGTYFHTLLVGPGWTLATALLAWVIALVLGSVLGVMRTTPSKWAVRLGNAYVELFRNIPLLVQMFLWFFVMPEFLPSSIGNWIKQMAAAVGLVRPAVLCLGLLHRLRAFRAGPRGHPVAAPRPGMAGTGTGPRAAADYRFVPAARWLYRIVLPPLTSEFLNIIKNSSVAQTIGVVRAHRSRAPRCRSSRSRCSRASPAATLIYLRGTNGVVVQPHALARDARGRPGLHPSSAAKPLPATERPPCSANSTGA
jgi:glutamate/aspartate transport system permease protein